MPPPPRRPVLLLAGSLLLAPWLAPGVLANAFETFTARDHDWTAIVEFRRGPGVSSLHFEEVQDALHGRAPTFMLTTEELVKRLGPGALPAPCDVDCAQEVARRAGARWLVAGTVSRVRGSIRIEVTLDDIREDHRVATERTEVPTRHGSRRARSRRDRPLRDEAALLAERLFASLPNRDHCPASLEKEEPPSSREESPSAAGSGWLRWKPEAEAPREVVPLDVCQAVTGYYHEKGRWSGQYRLEAVTGLWTRPVGETWEVHVRYRYLCTRARCGGTLATGYDQRVFRFQLRDGAWEAVSMGPYLSARP